MKRGIAGGRWWILPVLACACWHVWAAGHYTIFDDEAFSCRRYTLPAADMLRALWHGAEPDPPLYYLMEHAAVRLLGVGPLGLRALSIVLFACGLLAIRAAAKAWFDGATADLSVLICAVHPAHLMLGFAARWYSAMFLATALLLWATARLRDTHGRTAAPVAAWSLAAAAACYVNYFGPVVVGLAWIVGVGGVVGSPEGRGRYGRWLAAMALAVLMYLPWLPAFWRVLTSFPDVSGGWTSAAATAARTLMALTSGSVASVQSWWVHGPLAMFAACAAALLLRYRARVWPMAVIVLGCIAAGAASRTLLDKYVLSFSGAACVLVAALLRRGWAEPTRDRRLAAVVAATALAAAWVGCGVNMARGSGWASLRWHDPFGPAMREMMSDVSLPPPDQWTMAHPSAWYYFGVETLRRADAAGGASQRGGPPWRRLDGAAWRRLAVPGEAGGAERVPLSAEAMLPRLKLSPLDAVVTVETADFAEAPAWRGLMAYLQSSYYVATERQYLEDPDHALKDRLDPKFRHPRWRITVRHWRRIAPQ